MFGSAILLCSTWADLPQAMLYAPCSPNFGVQSACKTTAAVAAKIPKQERCCSAGRPLVGEFADKLESHTIETISLLCAGAHATPEELCALRCGLLEAAAALVHAAAVPLPPRPLEADGSTTAEVAAEADAAHHLTAAVQVMLPSALAHAFGGGVLLIADGSIQFLAPGCAHSQTKMM